jgi:hypothetical protein
VYRLHGLLKQNRLVERIPDDHPKKIELEGELKSTHEALLKNKIYLESDDKKKKAYYKPKEARLIKTDELVKNTGMAKLIEQWGLFSNYVHAEHIGDRQYNQFYKEKSGLLESISTTIEINQRITSELIFQLCEKYDFAKKWFDSLPKEEQVQIEHWRKITDHLENK